MRFAIVAVLALALGAASGAFFVHGKMTDDLNRLRLDLDEAQDDARRLGEELEYASLENKRLRRDKEQLSQQLDMITVNGPAPQAVPSGEPVQVASLASDAEPGNGLRAVPRQASAFKTEGQEGAVDERIAPVSSQDMPASQQPVAAVQRPVVEEILYADMETSSDPTEQARLENIHEHLMAVYENYAMLNETEDPDQRSALMNNVLQARQNLKSLVRSQQDEVVRRAVAQAGVTDPEQQLALIDSFQQVKDSPYFTEPLLVWGMAAPEY